jgi:hypothetical protein
MESIPATPILAHARRSWATSDRRRCSVAIEHGGWLSLSRLLFALQLW